MIVEFYSFILSFFCRKDERNCLICLEGGFTKKLPCNICLNKYIHRDCLNNYRRYKEENVKCFVCNTGNLDYVRENSIECIRISNWRGINRQNNLLNYICSKLCIFSIVFGKVGIFYLFGIITSGIIISIISKGEIEGILLTICLICGGLIGILYWYLYTKKVCEIRRV